MNPHHAVSQQLRPHLDLPEVHSPDAANGTAEQPGRTTATDCPRLGIWADGR